MNYKKVCVCKHFLISCKRNTLQDLNTYAYWHITLASVELSVLSALFIRQCTVPYACAHRHTCSNFFDKFNTHCSCIIMFCI